MLLTVAQSPNLCQGQISGSKNLPGQGIIIFLPWNFSLVAKAETKKTINSMFIIDEQFIRDL